MMFCDRVVGLGRFSTQVVLMTSGLRAGHEMLCNMRAGGQLAEAQCCNEEQMNEFMADHLRIIKALEFPRYLRGMEFRQLVGTVSGVSD